MTAKAVATAWKVPLLRFDMGALKSKYVGESEANLRRAFKVIESVGRCVVWVDEIEKALQGATSGSADGGVSADALGALLAWMQDRTSEAFVVATANNVDSLPPELLRKGRFDELFFVDLPNPIERADVVRAALRSYGRGGIAIDAVTVANACDKFTGAEIASLVPEALFAAFGDGGREIVTADLIAAARYVVPLAETAPEKIKRMRDWVKGRARPATSTAVTPVEGRKPVRALDI
jgi:SpoVK/Ycf46/Vps4 family AAA+-type ATPase